MLAGELALTIAAGNNDAALGDGEVPVALWSLLHNGYELCRRRPKSPSTDRRSAEVLCVADLG